MPLSDPSASPALPSAAPRTLDACLALHFRVGSAPPRGWVPQTAERSLRASEPSGQLATQDPVAFYEAALAARPDLEEQVRKVAGMWVERDG